MPLIKNIRFTSIHSVTEKLHLFCVGLRMRNRDFVVVLEFARHKIVSGKKGRYSNSFGHVKPIVVNFFFQYSFLWKLKALCSSAMYLSEPLSSPKNF